MDPRQHRLPGFPHETARLDKDKIFGLENFVRQQNGRLNRFATVQIAPIVLSSAHAAVVHIIRDFFANIR